MNYLDIVIAIILLIFAIKGLKKGLILEVVSLLAFAVGIYGAMHFSDFTAAKLQEVTQIKPQHINTIAVILTFIILVIVVNLIGKLVKKIIRSLNLGFVDKIGGFLMGGAKGVLLCSLMMVVLNNFQLLGIIKPEVKQQSLLFPFVEKTVPYIYKGFDFVKDTVHDLKHDEDETEVSSSSESQENEAEETVETTTV